MVTTPLVIAYDIYRIGKAVKSDWKKEENLGRKTVVTVVTIGASWVGSYAGQLAGAEVGIFAGTAIGMLFSPAGAVAGAAVGCLVGGIAGTLAGSYIVSKSANLVINKILGKEKIIMNEPIRTIILYICTSMESTNLMIYGLEENGTEIFLLKETDEELLEFLSVFPKSFKAKLKAVVFNIHNYKHPEELYQQEFYLRFVEFFICDNISCYFIDETLLRATALIISTGIALAFEESILILNINDNAVEVVELKCKEHYYEITAVRVIICEEIFDSNTIRAKILGNSNPSFVIISHFEVSNEGEMQMDLIKGIILHDEKIITYNDNYMDYAAHAIIQKTKIEETLHSMVFYGDNLLNSSPNCSRNA